nr:ribonuclease H-like domain-containing protein [Tanacetum cinerariifolium]
MSFDELYNNFKIVEQEVKRTVVSSSSSRSPDMAFLSSLSSTNEVDTASIQVSAASTPVSTVSSPNNIAKLSDATVYAFLANQPNGSQLVHEDLEQIHEDDLEEIDLKWQLALLSMRVRRYFQKTGKKITINGSDTTGYDKIKVMIRFQPTWHLWLSQTQSTNEVDTASIQVSAFSTPVSTFSSPNNTVNLSDSTVYSFLSNQPNGSQLVHEDIEQIHEDDLEEIDLKWQLALLSMRAKRYFQRIGKKIAINGSDTAGYDKTKLECFNCHKMGHFAREYRSPRSQKSRPRNQDSSRKTVIVEYTSSKAMMAIDRAGFDWKYLGEDEVPTNMALMAFSDSEVHNSKTCSNTYLKSFETLKNKYEILRIELNKFEFDLANYKIGLAFVEEQLVFYKKNEVAFCDQVAVLKRDASFREFDIIALNLQLEKLKKEKESNQIKIDNFKKASKSLDKLIGSHITDNSKTGLGFTSYNAITPPPSGLLSPPTIDLSSFSLEEFKQPEFESYGPKASKSVCVDTLNVIKKVSDALIIKDWVSDYDEDESEEVVVKSKKVRHKPDHLIKDCDFHDKKMVLKPVLKTVEKKTGQREVRPAWNHAMRVNYQNFSNSRRNFAPTAVFTKSGIVPISIASKALRE